MSSSKSVRFAANVNSSNNRKKRPHPQNDNENDEDDYEEKSKRFRLNEDEMDDVDDWKREDDDDDGGGGVVPSEHELLEAKRKRRQKLTEGVDGSSTTINDTTSLATEGITIEPFHMRREESDGTGYFDGDTYVWRKNDPNETPDAWLDSLNDDNNNKNSSAIASLSKARDDDDDEEENEEKGESMDDLSKEQLYRKILPLLSGNETVAQAVRRYGKITKQNQQRKKDGAASSAASSSEAYKLAKSCLDELTGCANALLLKGEVDIYDTRRQTVLKYVPLTELTEEDEGKKQPPADWEYMGNQDGKIHGPYTTQQMIGWMSAGYFVGQQKVKIRTIRKKEMSTEEDLLADLMDDDEELGDNKQNNNDAETVKGEWQWSDEINMTNYLA